MYRHPYIRRSGAPGARWAGLADPVQGRKRCQGAPGTGWHEASEPDPYELRRSGVTKRFLKELDQLASCGKPSQGCRLKSCAVGTVSRRQATDSGASSSAA